MTDKSAEPFPDAVHHVTYRRCRENITRLVTSGPSVADLPVAACPGWSVRDLVGHLVVVCRMAVDEEPGDISDPPPPPPGIPVPELVIAWAELEKELPRVLPRADWLRRRILPLDAFSHELDLRAALGMPPPDRHPALADALDLAAMGFTLALHEHSLPALCVQTPDRVWTVGEGEPAATLSGESMDIFRALTGRRTVRQIGELSWSTEPDRWLPAFTWGPFTLPTHLVEEAAGGVVSSHLRD
ncbi:maleylpyruvate isomerase family mycothiol-dependent enzyme [Streptomyces niveiscabiei]|uniref:maleylpyruvate isomerase family mycothiol-dependent enzyme n=1 Tax=Streptomyces niveiscabiei TaxID=164115 RepID=UPI0029B1FD8C|nr:maleylpyruvate isomerase family mycothiol-dependent enzyme [Streptomyces niveiscabiei]MDX3385235.1 maleylpyruvate isomerase family mycothiol-dependent enzyme [Streptomyces niveiscabiei]